MTLHMFTGSVVVKDDIAYVYRQRYRQFDGMALHMFTGRDTGSLMVKDDIAHVYRQRFRK